MDTPTSKNAPRNSAARGKSASSAKAKDAALATASLRAKSAAAQKIQGGIRGKTQRSANVNAATEKKSKLAGLQKERSKTSPPRKRITLEAAKPRKASAPSHPSQAENNKRIKERKEEGIESWDATGAKSPGSKQVAADKLLDLRRKEAKDILKTDRGDGSLVFMGPDPETPAPAPAPEPIEAAPLETFACNAILNVPDELLDTRARLHLWVRFLTNFAPADAPRVADCLCREGGWQFQAEVTPLGSDKRVAQLLLVSQDLREAALLSELNAMLRRPLKLDLDGTNAARSASMEKARVTMEGTAKAKLNSIQPGFSTNPPPELPERALDQTRMAAAARVQGGVTGKATREALEDVVSSGESLILLRVWKKGEEEPWLEEPYRDPYAYREEREEREEREDSPAGGAPRSMLGPPCREGQAGGRGGESFAEWIEQQWGIGAAGRQSRAAGGASPREARLVAPMARLSIQAKDLTPEGFYREWRLRQGMALWGRERGSIAVSHAAMERGMLEHLIRNLAQALRLLRVWRGYAGALTRIASILKYRKAPPREGGNAYPKPKEGRFAMVDAMRRYKAMHDYSTARKLEMAAPMMATALRKWSQTVEPEPPKRALSASELLSARAARLDEEVNLGGEMGQFGASLGHSLERVRSKEHARGQVQERMRQRELHHQQSLCSTPERTRRPLASPYSYTRPAPPRDIPKDIPLEEVSPPTRQWEKTHRRRGQQGSKHPLSEFSYRAIRKGDSPEDSRVVRSLGELSPDMSRHPEDLDASFTYFDVGTFDHVWSYSSRCEPVTVLPSPMHPTIGGEATARRRQPRVSFQDQAYRRGGSGPIHPGILAQRDRMSGMVANDGPGSLLKPPDHPDHRNLEERVAYSNKELGNADAASLFYERSLARRSSPPPVLFSYRGDGYGGAHHDGGHGSD